MVRLLKGRRGKTVSLTRSNEGFVIPNRSFISCHIAISLFSLSEQPLTTSRDLIFGVGTTMSDPNNLDEISSVLFMAREALGTPARHLSYPTDKIAYLFPSFLPLLKRLGTCSVQSPPENDERRVPRFNVERSGILVEGTGEGVGDWGEM